MMSDEMRTAEELARLSWLEAATIRAYDSVEQKTEDEDLRQQLGAFRSDHARHLSRMHRLLQRTAGGVQPPPEFVEFVRDELSLVENASGLGDALSHLLLLERANASFFADALAEGLPAEAARLVAEEREDEQHHVGEVALRLPSRGPGEDERDVREGRRAGSPARRDR